MGLRGESSVDDATGPESGIPQGGVVPYLIQDGRVQFCLISLSSQSGWGFPKGTVDPPETVAAAALREAFEEAGIRGHIVGEPLGGYSYVKRGMRLDVTVFLMAVTAVEPYWPERRQRQRQFCTVEQANLLLAVPGQRQLLDQAIQRIKPLLRAGAEPAASRPPLGTKKPR